MVTHPDLPTSGGGGEPRSDRVFLALVLLAAAAIRCYQLGTEGLWFDEAHTAVLARLPLPDLIHWISIDNQAPLYFLLVKGVTALLGTREWAIRSLSMVAGVVAVWLAFDLGRRLLSPTAGRLAALLLATSPMALHYSQEARPYALLMALVLADFRLAWELDRRPTAGRAVALATALLATMLVHDIGPFYVAGVALAFVFSRRRDLLRLRRWGLALGLAGLGLLPWLPRLLGQIGGLERSFAWQLGVWKHEFPWQIPRSLAAMTHGSLAPIRNRVPDLPGTAWIALGLSALLWLAAFLRRGSLADRRAPLLLLAAGALPLAGVWLYSDLASVPIYLVGRIDSPALPLFLLLTAAGALALARPLVWAVPLAFIGLAIVPLQLHWTVDFKSQERSLAQLIADGRSPGDPVVTTAFAPTLVHYLSLDPGETLFVFPSARPALVDWVDWSAFDRDALRRDASALVDRVVSAARRSGGRRVWLVLHPDPRYAPIAAALDSRLRLEGGADTGFLGVLLKVYEIPASLYNPDQRRDDGRVHSATSKLDGENVR